VILVAFACAVLAGVAAAVVAELAAAELATRRRICRRARDDHRRRAFDAELRALLAELEISHSEPEDHVR